MSRKDHSSKAAGNPAGNPANTTLISQRTLRILDEVRKAGGQPWERLKAKAQWEHMSLTAVIKEWGDPRRNWTLGRTEHLTLTWSESQQRSD